MPFFVNHVREFVAFCAPGPGCRSVRRWSKQGLDGSASEPPWQELPDALATEGLRAFRWFLFLSEPRHRLLDAFAKRSAEPSFREFLVQLWLQWQGGVVLEPELAPQTQDLGGLAFERVFALEALSGEGTELRALGLDPWPEPSEGRVAELDRFYPPELDYIVGEIFRRDIERYPEESALGVAPPSWGVWRALFQRANQRREECVVHHLGARGGFIAELGLVAQAMILALDRGLELRLDSSGSPYFEGGWAEYFEPICPEHRAKDEWRTVLHIRNLATGADTPEELAAFNDLKSVHPERIEFEGLSLGGYEEIRRLCTRMLFHPNGDTRAAVDRLVERLELGRSYVALHLRRGDKVGDEDLYYPTPLYLEKLGPVAPEEPIFVMSDDYAAVLEVKEALEERGLANPVRTLCNPRHRGFDISQVRKGRYFFGREAFEPESKEAYQSYMRDENIRLLAEIEVAASARRFVSTYESNIGKTIRMLHPQPEACELMSATPELESLLREMRARAGQRQPLLAQ